MLDSLRGEVKRVAEPMLIDWPSARRAGGGPVRRNPGVGEALGCRGWFRRQPASGWRRPAASD